MDKAYAFVHLTDIAYSIDKAYSYSVPHEYRKDIRIGSVVVVPFGNANKRVSAVVVGFSDECDYKRIKSIDSIMQYPFEVPDDLISTCSFMKERFFCTFGSAFRAVIPPGVNLDSETVYSLVEECDTSKLNTPAEVVVREINLKKQMTERELINEYGEECKILLNSLCRIGVLKRESRVVEKFNEKNLFTYSLTVSNEEAESLIDSGEGLTEKQRGLIGLLMHYPLATMREIEEIGGYSAAIANVLIKKGFVEKRETAFFREAYSLDGIEPEGEYTLSVEQKEACEGIKALIESDSAKAALLFGVTGSGKTRVIIESAKEVIKRNKQVIILIPEIGLASQAVKAYAAAFGSRLAVIHSMLSVGERTDTYRRIQAGEIDVVIGTRSAVFAPFASLGMIAIDEEQAHTYKSEMQPKYNAIDIARFRCTKSNALMLLASATPSIESFYKAKKGIYSLFTLNKRYSGSELPEVIIEDMRDEVWLNPDKLIGKRLALELNETKRENKQGLLFVNRRGFNSHVSCRSCGFVFTCPSCSVSLTRHEYNGLYKGEARLSCHYCGYTAKSPKICPACGSTSIGFSGFGTQKLQDELERDFPDLKITRMDSDTTSGRFSHDKLINEFASKQSDVLIGTQMISKGFDFPEVNLAGAVNVDSSLYMDDFRASERTFSLITQLVGRAGRSGKRGKAILQTYNPDNEVLNLAAKQDYESFYESEIALRKAVKFPPFCTMAVFGFTSVSESDCEKFAQIFDTMLYSLYEKSYKDITLYKFGPFKNGIYKVMGKYRMRIIVKYNDNARSREFLSNLLIEGLQAAPKNVKLDLDANPSII
ncbi:MAG: primosomal protein N' [Ruminococcaceae bacterium]|nr:primosomal protein N' [Oscillospiraceae bacterium]